MTQETTTIQKTSKPLKKHILASVIAIFFGLIWFVSGANGFNFGAMIMAAGAVWFLFTRFRIWWHHE
jgi:hypothetical protein